MPDTMRDWGPSQQQPLEIVSRRKSLYTPAEDLPRPHFGEFMRKRSLTPTDGMNVSSG